MERALIDTGFWYALFNPRDDNHASAQYASEMLEHCVIVIPWPTLYETVRTRLVRNAMMLQLFENYLKDLRVEFLPDDDYRDSALELSFRSSLHRRRPLSMVDCLLRLLIEDSNVNVDYLVTFNHQDFSDVCTRHRVEIL